MKKILLLLFMAMMTYSVSLSQDDNVKTLNVNDAVTEETTIDTLINNDDDMLELKFRIGFDMPTVEVQYIMATPNFNYDGTNSVLKETRGVEIKLGNTDIVSMGKGLSEYDFGYLYFNNIHDKYGDVDDAELGGLVDAWNIGLGSHDGYAYNLGNNSHIVLYHGTGWNWSYLDFSNTNQIGSDDYKVFGDHVRFGDMFDAGIKIKYGAIGISAGYQRISIFPRHLFWHWTLSEIIEHGAEGLLDKFVIKIFRSTPIALPIVNMVLKAGLSYAVTELRADNMNWPSSTVGPMMFDNVKLGMTFTF